MRKRRTKEKKNKGKIEQRENITKEKRKVTVNATGSYKGRMIMYDVLVIGAGPAAAQLLKSWRTGAFGFCLRKNARYPDINPVPVY